MNSLFGGPHGLYGGGNTGERHSGHGHTGHGTASTSSGADHPSPRPDHPHEHRTLHSDPASHNVYNPAGEIVSHHATNPLVNRHLRPYGIQLPLTDGFQGMSVSFPPHEGDQYRSDSLPSHHHRQQHPELPPAEGTHHPHHQHQHQEQYQNQNHQQLLQIEPSYGGPSPHQLYPHHASSLGPLPPQFARDPTNVYPGPQALTSGMNGSPHQLGYSQEPAPNAYPGPQVPPWMNGLPYQMPYGQWPAPIDASPHSIYGPGPALPPHKHHRSSSLAGPATGTASPHLGLPQAGPQWDEGRSPHDIYSSGPPPPGQRESPHDIYSSAPPPLGKAQAHLHRHAQTESPHDIYSSAPPIPATEIPSEADWQSPHKGLPQAETEWADALSHREMPTPHVTKLPHLPGGFSAAGSPLGHGQELHHDGQGQDEEALNGVSDVSSVRSEGRYSPTDHHGSTEDWDSRSRGSSKISRWGDQQSADDYASDGGYVSGGGYSDANRSRSDSGYGSGGRGYGDQDYGDKGYGGPSNGSEQGSNVLIPPEEDLNGLALPTDTTLAPNLANELDGVALAAEVPGNQADSDDNDVALEPVDPKNDDLEADPVLPTGPVDKDELDPSLLPDGETGTKDKTEIPEGMLDQKNGKDKSKSDAVRENDSDSDQSSGEEVTSSSGSSRGDDAVEESSDTEMSEADSDTDDNPVRVRKGKLTTVIKPKSARMNAGKRSDSLVSEPSSEPSEEEVDKVHKKYVSTQKMPEEHSAESPEFPKDNDSAKSDGESMADNASEHFTHHVESKDGEESQSSEVGEDRKQSDSHNAMSADTGSEKSQAVSKRSEVQHKGSSRSEDDLASAERESDNESVSKSSFTARRPYRKTSKDKAASRNTRFATEYIQDPERSSTDNSDYRESQTPSETSLTSETSPAQSHSDQSLSESTADTTAGESSESKTDRLSKKKRRQAVHHNEMSDVDASESESSRVQDMESPSRVSTRPSRHTKNHAKQTSQREASRTGRSTSTASSDDQDSDLGQVAAQRHSVAVKHQSMLSEKDSEDSTNDSASPAEDSQLRGSPLRRESGRRKEGYGNRSSRQAPKRYRQAGLRSYTEGRRGHSNSDRQP